MLWLLDTGKMAHRHGKWRGLFTGLHGLLVCFIGTIISKLENLTLSFAPSGVEPSGPNFLTWLWMGVFAVGVLTILAGAWQLYKDQMHGAYINDADHYQREGW